jgi:hypothetical protein
MARFARSSAIFVYKIGPIEANEFTWRHPALFFGTWFAAAASV